MNVNVREVLDRSTAADRRNCREGSTDENQTPITNLAKITKDAANTSGFDAVQKRQNLSPNERDKREKWGHEYLSNKVIPLKPNKTPKREILNPNNSPLAISPSPSSSREDLNKNKKKERQGTPYPSPASQFEKLPKKTNDTANTSADAFQKRQNFSPNERHKREQNLEVSSPGNVTPITKILNPVDMSKAPILLGNNPQVPPDRESGNSRLDISPPPSSSREDLEKNKREERQRTPYPGPAIQLPVTWELPKYRETLNWDELTNRQNFANYVQKNSINFVRKEFFSEGPTLFPEFPPETEQKTIHKPTTIKLDKPFCSWSLAFKVMLIAGAILGFAMGGVGLIIVNPIVAGIGFSVGAVSAIACGIFGNG